MSVVQSLLSAAPASSVVIFDKEKFIGGAYGYHRTLLHFTSEEDLRTDSELKRREGGVVQCTDEDPS